ncbi:hypothetical protein PCE1_003687 [Barthelona sp. PCE]
MSVYRAPAFQLKPPPKLSRVLEFHQVPSIQAITALLQWHDGYLKGERELEDHPCAVEPVARNSDESLLFQVLSKNVSSLVRATLVYNGFLHTSTSKANLTWSSDCPRLDKFSKLKQHTWINHHPRIYELTHKDRMIVNFERMMQINGDAFGDFLPKSFILPAEEDLLCEYMDPNSKYIIKPARGRRGERITVSLGRDILISNPWEERNSQQPTMFVVSDYVDPPFLVRGRKHDIRIYVLLYSVNPMVVFIYEEGLVRLASEEYDENATEFNEMRDLTNFSLNKHNATSDDIKMCMKEYMRTYPAIWEQIKTIVLRSCTAYTHHYPSVNYEKYESPKCFSLLGFDVMVDANMQAWLLEVNMSPSLNHNNCELDFKVKSRLMSDIFNIIGVRRIFRNQSIKKRKKKRKEWQNTVTRDESITATERMIITSKSTASLRSPMNRSMENIIECQGIEEEKQYLEGLTKDKQRMRKELFSVLKRSETTQFECLFPTVESKITEELISCMPEKMSLINSILHEWVKENPLKKCPKQLIFPELDKEEMSEFFNEKTLSKSTSSPVISLHSNNKGKRRSRKVTQSALLRQLHTSRESVSRQKKKRKERATSAIPKKRRPISIRSVEFSSK